MEAEFQCELALLAFGDLEGAIWDLSSDYEMSEFRMRQNRFWLSLQGFLISSANLSKLLWPNSNRKVFIRKRGEELRDSVGVTESSPINSRDLRNHLEHFDERLEEWTSLGIGMVKRCIGGTGSFDVLNPMACLGTFNQETFTFKFHHDTLDLRPLRDAIDALREMPHGKVERGRCIDILCSPRQ